MAIQKKMTLVCTGLALCNVLADVAARAQNVSFDGARNFAAGGAPDCVAIGDFNGDGVPDLAVANEGTYPLYADSGM